MAELEMLVHIAKTGKKVWETTNLPHHQTQTIQMKAPSFQRHRGQRRQDEGRVTTVRDTTLRVTTLQLPDSLLSSFSSLEENREDNNVEPGEKHNNKGEKHYRPCKSQEKEHKKM
jgi:hypothetical protein